LPHGINIHSVFVWVRLVEYLFSVLNELLHKQCQLWICRTGHKLERFDISCSDWLPRAFYDVRDKVSSWEVIERSGWITMGGRHHPWGICICRQIGFGFLKAWIILIRCRGFRMFGVSEFFKHIGMIMALCCPNIKQTQQSILQLLVLFSAGRRCNRKNLQQVILYAIRECFGTVRSLAVKS
jgi:hypothetical protein